MKKKVLLAIIMIALSTLAFCVISASAKTNVSKDKKSFTITPVNVEYGKTVILALYNGKQFVEIKSAVYTGEEIPYTTTKDYTNAKVMVWDDLTSLKPVCEVENVKIQTSGDSDEPEKPEDDEILIYSLLDDGTYGVMAGEDAATQATITIPESYNNIAVTQILTGGFKNLTVLQSISIPDSITIINQNAFSGCTSLTSVTIPGSVTFIGKYAFYQSGLATATFENANISGTDAWRLADGVIVKPRGYERNLYALKASYYVDERIVSYECDISNPSNAAKALTVSYTLKVEGDGGNVWVPKVNLYSVNWFVN